MQDKKSGDLCSRDISEDAPVLHCLPPSGAPLLPRLGTWVVDVGPAYCLNIVQW